MDLSRKLAGQTQRLELTVSQRMAERQVATVDSLTEVPDIVEYVNESDEVIICELCLLLY